jgi:hypothetical protein
MEHVTNRGGMGVRVEGDAGCNRGVVGQRVMEVVGMRRVGVKISGKKNCEI